MLLSAEHISKNYGDRQLLDDVSFYLLEGAKVGLIGVNGTGKSTFLNILAGEAEPDAGCISRDPNVKISYLSQNPPMRDADTPLNCIFASDSADFRAQEEYEARSMLDRLEIDDMNQAVGAMSGGQRKRVALVRAFVHPSDVLILDEPTNHLDSEMAAWLEEKLVATKRALVMVTHDRFFLERVVNVIAEISRGKLYSCEANYSKYLELKAQRLEMAEASERKRQAALRREYQWIMRGARARSTKSVDRIQRYEDLLEQKAPETDSSVEIAAPTSRLGKKIIELANVSKAYGERRVIKDFSLVLHRDDRIGIVGKNGAGKSTLLGLISQRVESDSGAVEIGATVNIGYFSQEGREMNPDERVYDFVRQVAGEVKTGEGTFSATQMLERFLFPSERQYSPIGRLSGGERRRLYLLSVLMAAPNVLLLDEPTNDLDIETLAVLEDYLLSFQGAVLAVSHDRYFLDKIANHILEVRSGGEIERYSGNYSDYALKRREETKPISRKPDSPAPRRESTAPRKLKFSFKEQREYETIDADIESIEASIAKCDADALISASDYLKLQELDAQKAELAKLLDEKTERWLYLNELAEKIAMQNDWKQNV